MPNGNDGSDKDVRIIPNNSHTQDPEKAVIIAKIVLTWDILIF